MHMHILWQDSLEHLTCVTAQPKKWKKLLLSFLYPPPGSVPRRGLKGIRCRPVVMKLTWAMHDCPNEQRNDSAGGKAKIMWYANSIRIAKEGCFEVVFWTTTKSSRATPWNSQTLQNPIDRIWEAMGSVQAAWGAAWSVARFPVFV